MHVKQDAPLTLEILKGALEIGSYFSKEGGNLSCVLFCTFSTLLLKQPRQQTGVCQ